MKFITLKCIDATCVVALDHITVVRIYPEALEDGQQVDIWTSESGSPISTTLAEAEPLLAALDEYRYTPGFRRGTP